MVKEFIANLKSRALGADVHKALNPSQQIIKIVDEELVAILGGERVRAVRQTAAHSDHARRPAWGSGKTTLVGKL
ncbi:MAG: hypothetical protein R2703_06860 [Micropruina glycogenica]